LMQFCVRRWSAADRRRRPIAFAWVQLSSTSAIASLIFHRLMGHCPCWIDTQGTGMKWRCIKWSWWCVRVIRLMPETENSDPSYVT
jgi:hypothetical protein